MSSADKKRRSGLSQIETLLTLSVIAIFSAVAVQMVGSVRQSVRHEKLVSDINLLNRAVSIFLANGGQFRDPQNVDAILLQLKQRPPDGQNDVQVGVAKESVVDPRLSIRRISLAEQHRSTERIVWDARHFKFRVTTEPVPGIEEFWLNPDLAEVDFGIDETRYASVMDYASESKWIWDYKDRTPEYRQGTTLIPIGTPTSTVPSSPGGPPPPTSNPPTTPPPTPVGPTGGLALNVGSGSATASDGLALNLLSNRDVSAGKGEIAIGLAGLQIKLGNPAAGTTNLAWADTPTSAVGAATSGLGINAGSGSATPMDGIAANVGEGNASALEGIAANVGGGESNASNGISGNLGQGSSSATNGIGLNLGSGSATAGSAAQME